jgi:hypothetical protein
VVQQSRYDLIHILGDFEDSHVDLCFFESRGKLTEQAHQLKLSLKSALMQKGNIFDVDEHLIDGYICFAAQFKLELHASDQDIVDTFVFFMKLPLLVVESVKDILNI